MDHMQRPTFETSSSMSNPAENINPNQLFTQFDSGSPGRGAGSGQSFPEHFHSLDSSSIWPYDSEQAVKILDQIAQFANNQTSLAADWDPIAMLSSLLFIDQRIHHVQDVIHSAIDIEGSVQPNELAVKQQLVTKDLVYIMSQLMSTVGNLLPSINDTFLNGTISQQNEGISSERNKVMQHRDSIESSTDSRNEGTKAVPDKHHDEKDWKDSVDGENLSPGSYEVLEPKKEEILALYTYFCSVCAKGFKRSANLRMHMRGHGDKYKIPAALFKPNNEESSETIVIKKYSCPAVGCKRNRNHESFQPLKSILCVKNHYKRSHCDKSYTCSRCSTKKFSFLADLKTHEKHCGRGKRLCSCGTTFSRKDKLLRHLSLFPGHSPAVSMGDGKASGATDQWRNSETLTGPDFQGNPVDDVDDLDLECFDGVHGYFSPLDFGGLDGIPQALDASERSFSPSGP